METTPTAPTKVYVLELVGDPVNSSGSITIEIGGTSLDRSKIEALKVEKDKALDDYFGDDEEHEDGDDWCYCNSDYSERPYWSISEYPLI